MLNVNAGLRSDLPAAIEASHAKTGRATPVSNAYLKVWAGVEDPPEDKGGDEQGVFYRDTDAICQVEFLGEGQDQIILRLRVEKQHGTHRFRSLEQRQKMRLIPGLAVDHGVQLRAFEAKDMDGTIELSHGCADILHR
jgi:hypothetical protein